MKTNYTNAKKVLPEALFGMIQTHFPDGGIMYVPPKSARGSQIRELVAMMAKNGHSSEDIAKSIGRTVRRVNQIKRDIGC